MVGISVSQRSLMYITINLQLKKQPLLNKLNNTNREKLNNKPKHIRIWLISKRFKHIDYINIKVLHYNTFF